MQLASNGKHNESIPAKRYFTIGEVSELCDVKSCLEVLGARISIFVSCEKKR